jgi:predicted short-subunit dehydrogenase-like oxidoreductase (DUF2520 family)
MRLRLGLVGHGRAGGALLAALGDRVEVVAVARRSDDVRTLAHGADVVVVATPDTAVAAVAAAIEPNDGCVVAHLSGALTLDVLAPHARRASLHPLVSMPDAQIGAERLRGAWMAVAGEPLARELAALLDGRVVEVADDDRVRYHAAAVVASNHVVALLGQVERIAATIGVPLDAYLELARGAIDNVAALGPSGALTGPVARGDWATVAAHLDALSVQERDGYAAMVELAKALT